jgi:hypothetical protein
MFRLFYIVMEICMQFYGTNDQVTLAFSLVLDTLRQYNAAESAAIPRLHDEWDARRAQEALPDSYAGIGPPPGRGGRSSASGRDRYAPYGSGGRAGYGGGRGMPISARSTVQMVPSAQPLVTVPGAVGTHPGIAGQVPMVLMQQADGTLVQVQVVSHHAGQYVAQPGTQLVRRS